MTYIQLFIQKAVAGGWHPEGHEILLLDFFETYFEYRAMSPPPHRGMELRQLQYEVVLLDPQAWLAVGIVQHWYEGYYGPEWQHHMHQMIDARCEGKTFEEFMRSVFEKGPKAA
jgi:hypothetical protein